MSAGKIVVSEFFKMNDYCYGHVRTLRPQGTDNSRMQAKSIFRETVTVVLAKNRYLSSRIWSRWSENYQQRLS